MIALKDCKDGYLYDIHARNGNCGVFIASVAGFLLRREKFGHIFPFVEYHRECPAFNTVAPHEELEKAPDLPWFKAGGYDGGCSPEDKAKVIAYLEDAERRFDIDFKGMQHWMRTLWLDRGKKVPLSQLPDKWFRLPDTKPRIVEWLRSISMLEE